MAFGLGALAAATIGSSVIGGLLGRSGQSSANRANSAQSLRQMEFQERMSNTAHVREVKDLRNAGLNPMLSVNAGASSPGGSQAVMKNENEQLASNVSNSAISLAQLSNLRAQTNLTNAQAASIKPISKIGDIGGSAIDTAKRTATGLYNNSASSFQRFLNAWQQNKSGITGKPSSNKTPYVPIWMRKKDARAYPDSGPGSKPHTVVPHKNETIVNKSFSLGKGRAPFKYQYKYDKSGKFLAARIKGGQWMTWPEFKSYQFKHRKN